MRVVDYKQLIAWQKSFNLSLLIYKISFNFPSEEKFGLTSQIRRCAVSIPSNIAEGWSRGKGKDYARFLSISLGSANELETQILISENLGYVNKDFSKDILENIIEIKKLLLSYIRQTKRQ